jgi:hypothetical protein
MPDGCFEDHAQRHDFIVECAARRRLGPRLVVALGERVDLLKRRHPVDPVFLHFARGDLVEGEASEKRDQMPLGLH